MVIFDLTRTAAEHINWEVIEDIKNGIMYSTKYETKMNIYNAPKIVVFMNSEPDMEKLYKDRYEIIYLPM